MKRHLLKTKTSKEMAYASHSGLENKTRNYVTYNGRGSNGE